MRVSEIMSKEVHTIRSAQTVMEAVTSMVRADHGLLVVVDDKMVGVVSDNDILSKVTAKGTDPSSVKVSDIMSTNVLWIDPGKTVSEAANRMREIHKKRLPVLFDGKLVGVISSTDIINSMIKTKKDLLDLALDF